MPVTQPARRSRAFKKAQAGRKLTLKLAAPIAALLGLSGTAPAQENTLPPGPGRDLVYGKCRTCHSLQYPKDSAGITRNQWDGVLDDMATYGLDIAPEERKKILNYLATYLGPNPPPKPSPVEQTAKAAPNGRQIFLQQCSACHQADGQGRTGEFPPLAGNPDLFRTREFPILVLLNGLQGPITVNGNDFNGQMPSFSYLPNEKIAALVQYVRSAWGNDAARPAGMDKVAPDDVADARKRELDPHAVHAYRKAHGGR